ncbi:MAG: GNAT family N-acetyltransferase, partial [Dokdonella sp.]|nr:GNAT family N-acetyltransferase [Dokdonella sp.]
MSAIPTLTTARLRLTALAERHFEAYAAMLADADNTRYIGDGQPLDRMNAWRSMAMLLGHWTLRGFGMWAVELKD